MTSDQIAAALCQVFSSEVELNAYARNSVGIMLPVTDEHSDMLEVYLSSASDGSWVVSDGGYLHREIALKIAQESPQSPVWEKVTATANRLDLQWGGGQLWSKVQSPDEIGFVLLAMIEAITAAVQASGQYIPKVQVQFWEEIALFFEDTGVEYTRNQRLVGVSQVSHRVDFVLRNGHPHVVQAISSEPSMRRSLNIFYDLLEAMPDVVPVAFVDEKRTGYSNETFEQLSYKSNVYLWRERDRFQEYWAGRA